MFTKNFYAMAKLSGISFNSYARYGPPAVNRSGITCYLKRLFTAYLDFNPRVGSISGGNYLYVGSGTTPPTENDYTMESVITSGISLTRSNVSGVDESGKIYSGLVINATNAGSSPVSISEIGGFMNIYASTTQNTTSADLQTFLLFRDVFPAVTLQPGQTVAINFISTLDEVIVT